MRGAAHFPAPPGRRLDQWLWFARLAKTRSLAARLCATGAVAINGTAVRKANYAVRIGDAVAVQLGAFRHTVRVLALGERRGPATEARLLYEETAVPVRLSDLEPAWTPLLAEEPPTHHREERGTESEAQIMPQSGRG